MTPVPCNLHAWSSNMINIILTMYQSANNICCRRTITGFSKLKNKNKNWTRTINFQSQVTDQQSTSLTSICRSHSINIAAEKLASIFLSSLHSHTERCQKNCNIFSYRRSTLMELAVHTNNLPTRYNLNAFHTRKGAGILVYTRIPWGPDWMAFQMPEEKKRKKKPSQPLIK